MSRRTESERTLWQRAMREVKPLPGRLQPGLRAKPAPPPAPAQVAPETRAPVAPLDRFAGIDRASAERLKRGKHRIEARLDLHGLTQDEAHRALLRFIRSARAAGQRCVVVITGRGRPHDGGGVLKAAVPRWFEEAEFRPHLLAISPAQPRDGGPGALYVMLRRNVTTPER